MSDKKGKAVAVVGSVKGAQDLLRAGRDNLASALPRGVDVGRFTQVVLTTVQTTPKLRECTRASFFLAALRAAQLGLDPIMGQCYLIPRRNRKKGVSEAHFMLGYQGMVELMLRSGLYRSVSAHCVYKGEHFVYEEGLEPRLVHRPEAPGAPEDLIAVYTRVQPKDGGAALFEVMWRSEIDLVRAKAQSQDVWGDPQSFPEMCKKTAVRRHSKYLRLTPEVAQAVAADDAVSFGSSEEARMAMQAVAEDVALDIEEEVDEEPGLADRLEEQRKLQKAADGVREKYPPKEVTEEEQAALEQAKAKAKAKVEELKAKIEACEHEVVTQVAGSMVCEACGEVIEEAGPPEGE